MRKLYIGLLLFSLISSGRAADVGWKFDFESRVDFTHVSSNELYSDAKGFGFEPGVSAQVIPSRGDTPALLEAHTPFYFSARLSEGNYRVTITFGGGQEASETTVKAELRRLMLEKVTTTPGSVVTRSFIVNVRRPEIPATDSIKAGIVKLKEPRETTQESWAWDDRLTLEFNGKHPEISTIQIDPVKVPTLYIMGDSTVCDQSGEPYTSWGQMLTRFFKNDLAIANHAESGETYEAAFGRRRIDKILSQLRPGDFFIVQFGHNDQKQDQKSGGGPFTTYQTWVEKCVQVVRAHHGIPFIVTPMERREFNQDGSFHPSLTDYAEAVRNVGRKLHVPVIDLNQMSQPFYQALEARGHDYSRKAFALTDNTHHNAYGAYELAKCVVMGIRASHEGLAQYIADDFRSFDPAHPDDPEAFAMPPSPKVTKLRPSGDGGVEKTAQ